MNPDFQVQDLFVVFMVIGWFAYMLSIDVGPEMRARRTLRQIELERERLCSLKRSARVFHNVHRFRRDESLN